MSPASIAVGMRELLASEPAIDLSVLHFGKHSGGVRELLVAREIDQITRVGPDTIVLLGDELALGGWIVSAAIRHAWERRAVAMVVPAASGTPTVIDLARRFDQTLLSTERNMIEVALAIAMRIGALRTGVQAHLSGVLAQVSQATSLDEVAQRLSAQLDGCWVAIEVAGITVSQAGKRSDAAVEILHSSPAGAVEPRLVLHTAVPPRARDRAAESLRVSAPAVRALLLAAGRRADRAADRVRSLAALSAVRPGAFEGHTLAQTASRLGWTPERSHVAVFLHCPGSIAELDGLDPAVQHLWEAAFGAIPAARVQDGWLAYLPARDGSRAPVHRLLRDPDIALLRRAGVTIGVSRAETDPARAQAMAVQAWLASRLANDDDGILGFEEIGLPLLSWLLPGDPAVELAASVYPELMADPRLDDVAGAVVALLNATGSMSKAAQRLGIHRNTLQARLRVAAELGIDLTRAEETLPIHLLLTAVLRARRAGGSSPPRRGGNGK